MSSGDRDDIDDRDDRDDRDDYQEQDRRADIRAARARVQTPAILMLVFAILSLVGVPLGAINFITFPAQMEAQRKQIDDNPQMPAAQKQEMKDLMTTWEKIFLKVLPFSMVFQLIIGVVSIIGSLKMKNLTSRGWAVTTAVLNIVSIGHGCCCLTLPIGIWALVVLMNRDVSAGFAAVAWDRAHGREHDRDRDSERYE